MKKIFPFIIIFLLIACNNKNEKKEAPQKSEGDSVEIKYARNFSIENFENYSILKIENPWPEADKSFIYLLAERDAEIPSEVEYDEKIHIPVEKIVVTSTTHIPALEALNAEKTLIGFPGLDLVSSEKTRKLINSDKIRELGKNEDINTEILIALEPQVVIGFAINGNNKTFETIQKTGIPVIFNGDWTEESPLGKAEWIKFFGALYGKTEEARRIFDEIESSYSEAKKLAETSENSPTVISGSMYRDQWYMPYGNSWQARFFKDANADYLYSDTEGDGSMALSFESVLDKAQEADFWISAGQFTSYEQLFDESRHYRQFKAVQEKDVYSVSLTKGETGGVLYYELGPQRPDLVLKDLVSVFHPDLLIDHEPVFFKALKNAD